MSSPTPRKLDSTTGFPVYAVDVGKNQTDYVRDFLAGGTGAVINGFALTQAIFAFASSPLMAEFEATGFVDVPTLSARHDLVRGHAVGLLRYLVTQDLFKEEANEVFAVTPRGRAVLSPGSLGLLQLYCGGYGHLMAQALPMLQGKLAYGADLRRDGYWVAKGSSMATHSLVDEVPYRVLEAKGITRVADLGCGAGDFLIDFAMRDPRHGGIGIDISAEAVEYCQRRAAKAGLGDRVRFAIGDCFDLGVLARHCGDIEVFYALAMEHELLRDGEQAVIGHIDRMAEVFGGRRFLLGEPTLNMATHDGMYYWIHVLSHQGMPRNVGGWCDLLRKLRRAVLENVFVPDHQQISAYYDIKF